MDDSFILNGCATGVNPLVKDKVVRTYLSSAEYSENNAWNLNPQTGQYNGNNNNKYNANQVRPVVALSKERINGWMAAYANCIAGKMTSEQCTLYRIHDGDLAQLVVECETRTYVPSVSICFCVRVPKIREVFAAAFRDRIVQHWICLRIEPLFEARFIEQGNVSWNCRKGCGTQRAVAALRNDILEVSCGYAREAFVGRFDIMSFFMSIDIRILERLVVPFVRERYDGGDKELLVYLLVTTIRHRPQFNCERRGDRSLWDKLDRSKSLFWVEWFRGLPIGNITSQLLANFYMSFFDEYMVGLCRAIGARYERFVDDFAVVCRTRTQVLMLRDKADVFLRERLNLSMHHDKLYVQDVTKGVRFVGSVIKMNRVYISNRTVAGLVSQLRSLQSYIDGIDGFTLDDAYVLEHFQSSINSYLGFMCGKQTYAIRRKVFKRFCPGLFGYMYFRGHFNVVGIYRKYSVIYNILKQESYE